MKLFTNRIVNPVNNDVSFENWVASQVKQASKIKEAREAKPECEDDPRGACRGQSINNSNEDGAEFQKGESVDGKKSQGGNARKDTGGTTDQNKNKQKDKEASSKNKTVEAKCGKEMGECSDAGKITEKHTEAAPGDDESDIKILINNDPNYQKGDSTKGKSKGESKKSDKPESKDKKEKKASNKMKFEKISNMSEENKLGVFSMLTSREWPTLRPNLVIAYAEALTGIKFANLKEEQKNKFKDFWKTLYPPEYVEEMVKDQ